MAKVRINPNDWKGVYAHIKDGVLVVGKTHTLSKKEIADMCFTETSPTTEKK